MVYERLRELAQLGNYAELARACAEISGGEEYRPEELSLAQLLGAYAHLRLNPHRNREAAFTAALSALETLRKDREEGVTHYADLALVIWGLMLQFVGRDQEAEDSFRQVLSLPGVSLGDRLTALTNLAYSLKMQDRRMEALDIFLSAAAELDALPEERYKPALRRERERVRCNVMDCYLELFDYEKAEHELSLVNHDILTDIMKLSILINRARLAIVRDEWLLADELGNGAHTEALRIGYIPFRIEALSILITVAGRLGRLAEQRRLVIEMASLQASPIS